MASRSVEQMVELQGRRWAQAHQEWAQAHDEATVGTPIQRPVVAISRLPYSGAHEVGARLAAELGYSFFGRELVDEIARERKVRRELVAGLDEHLENAIERYVIDGFRHRSFTESDYLRGLLQVVTTLSQQGAAVILGRGAASIVTASDGLRVLVVAPVEARRARMAESLKIAPAAARERLDRLDQERATFYERSFHFRQNDPLNYDLVVNTGSLSIDAAAATIAEALYRRFDESRPVHDRRR
jgi:cytidylate kinase